jgi:hypothetical protein
MISGFRRDVAENCVLSYYRAISANSLPTFRDNLSGLTLKMGPISFPKFRQGTTTTGCIINQKNTVLIRPYVDCVYVWGTHVLHGAVRVRSGHM